MQRVVLTIVAFILVNCVLFLFAFTNNTDIQMAIWASAIFWLNIIPIIHYLMIGRNHEIFPYIVILGFFITLSYSLPVFFIRPSSYEISPLSVDALMHAFWGYFIFYVSFFSFHKIFRFDRTFNVMELPASDLRIRIAAFVFLFIYLLSYKLFTIPSLFYLGSAGIYIYLGSYIYLLQLNIRTSFAEKIIFYLALVSTLSSGLLSGGIANLALPVLFIAIVLYISRRQFFKVIVLSLIFLTIYYLFAPIKYRYRQETWFSTKQLTTSEKLQLIYQLVVDKHTYDRDRIFPIDRERLHILWRPSYDASALSLVLAKTPSQVPFWNGTTYIFLPKFVPRIFWKNKPTEDASLKFAVKYKLIPQTETVSPYPLPILAETYMNFGDTGIVLGMMILAMIYVFLNKYFNNKNIKGVGKIYSIAIVFAFIYHEGNFTMTFGNVPLLTLCIFLICRIVQSSVFSISCTKAPSGNYIYGYHPLWSEKSNPFKDEVENIGRAEESKKQVGSLNFEEFLS